VPRPAALQSEYPGSDLKELREVVCFTNTEAGRLLPKTCCILSFNYIPSRVTLHPVGSHFTKSSSFCHGGCPTFPTYNHCDSLKEYCASCLAQCVLVSFSHLHRLGRGLGPFQSSQPSLPASFPVPSSTSSSPPPFLPVSTICASAHTGSLSIFPCTYWQVNTFRITLPLPGTCNINEIVCRRPSKYTSHKTLAEISLRSAAHRTTVNELFWTASVLHFVCPLS
jgi:hypothetical protein